MLYREVIVLKENQHKVIDLEFLSMATREIAHAKDFQSACEIIFDFIESLVSFNMVIIYEIDKKQKELRVVACRGSNVKNLRDRVPFKIGEGAVGWVAQHKKALLLEDALVSEGLHVRQFFDEDPIIRSFLAVPLIVGNDLIGILSMSSSSPSRYKQQDVELITIIASQAAAILQLNNEVKETTRFSNHILENINSGVIVIDSSYKIIVFNKAAEKISGYTSNEVMGKNILDIPLKENKQDWYIVESLEKEVVFFEIAGYMKRKDNQRVNIRLSTSILKNDDGTKKGCICIFRDNTEIEKLQQQIMRAEKLAAIGRVTAGIAHEIRNPLLPIRTACQLLLKKMSEENSSEQISRLLNIIHEESERLNRFLDEFIGMSKEMKQLKGKSLLGEVLGEILILVKPNTDKNGIKILLEFSNGDIWIPIAKDHAKQIFLNLLLNSIDAVNGTNNEQKKIIIKVEMKSEKVIVEFSDNGIGIKEEDLNQIFDPFYTTKENGTGLGLPTVHNLLSIVGGEIFVDSKLNDGTKFTIILPVEEQMGGAE